MPVNLTELDNTDDEVLLPSKRVGVANQLKYYKKLKE
jgi:hypothetical protein